MGFHRKESAEKDTDLHVAFRYIERGDGSMSDTASKSTANQGLRVIGRVMRGSRVEIARKDIEDMSKDANVVDGED